MSPSLAKARLAPLAASIIVTLLLLGLFGVSLAGSAPSTGPNHADLVIDLGDGRVLTRRITFSETSISGQQALFLTDLDLEVVNFPGIGSAICAIEGVGCPASNCFCGGDKFWGYSFWDGAAWQGYPVGISGSTLSDGAVDGHHWGVWGYTPPAVNTEWLAAKAALNWLQPQQSANGSYGNPGATLDTVLAVAASEENPARWKSESGSSLIDYLQLQAGTYAGQSAAAAGKLAVGVAAAGLDPQSFGGQNLTTHLASYYNPATGAYGSTHVDQAFAMLGLAAAGQPIPAAAAQRLASTAHPDGGWGWLDSAPSDVDSTSLALQALTAAGEPVTSTAIVSGLAFIRSAQLLNADGGFAHSPGLSWGRVSNVNSTAFAIQGLVALGQDPLSAAWQVSGTTPISYLLSHQLPDGPFVYVDPPANLYATQQAVPALLGRSLIQRSPAIALRQALAWISTQQQADGSFAGFGVGATVDAVLAIVAAGGDPASFISGVGQSPLDYLASQAAAYSAQSAAAAGKLTLAATSVGADPHNFGGVDLIARIDSFLNPTTGQFGSSVWDQALAMLGLAASRHPVPAEAVQFLLAADATGGGWSFMPDASAADADSTGLVLQALGAAGASRDTAAVRLGFLFLEQAQNPDGGFPGFGGATDIPSTGLVLMGLAAYGEDPHSLRWTRMITDGSASRLTWHTAVDAALAQQSPEGGFAGWSGPNDPFSTYQVVPGIAGRPFNDLARRTLALPIILRSN